MKILLRQKPIEGAYSAAPPTPLADVIGCNSCSYCKLFFMNSLFIY